MNMIQSEQIEAWGFLSSLHNQNAIYLTSGIRKEEQDSYLKLTHGWKWTLQQTVEEDGWMAFVFVNS